MLRHIGILGDIHGEDTTLEAFLHFLATQDLDTLLCTGDLPAKRGGDTPRCITLLEQAGVVTIRGNHDRWAVTIPDDYERGFGERVTAYPLDVRAYLAALPPTHHAETPLGKLLLCHGLGTKDMVGIYPDGTDSVIAEALRSFGIVNRFRIVVAGHTHRRMVRWIDDILLLNAGTLLPQDEEAPGVLIVDTATGTVATYELGGNGEISFVGSQCR